MLSALSTKSKRPQLEWRRARGGSDGWLVGDENVCRELKVRIKKLRAKVEVGQLEEGQMKNRLENKVFYRAKRAYTQSLALGKLVSDELMGRCVLSLSSFPCAHPRPLHNCTRLLACTICQRAPH